MYHLVTTPLLLNSDSQSIRSARPCELTRTSIAVTGEATFRAPSNEMRILPLLDNLSSILHLFAPPLSL